MEDLHALGQEIEDDINPIISEMIAEVKRNPAAARQLVQLALKLNMDKELTEREMKTTRTLAGVMCFKILNKAVQD